MTLLDLAERLEGASKPDNALDVLIEVALFEPDGLYAAVRPNAAGTKVVYTLQDGTQQTCWADDWTREGREEALLRLRARAAMEG